ncbi:MAG TPA: DUF4019 domain-containing protein [Acidobacteriota bacterium]|nr:DUF4019 domain-containing protein [Acidobacteriota bacterium]
MQKLKSWKLVLLVVLVLSLNGITKFASTDSQQDAKAAQKVAESWLSLIDQGKYEQSWDEGSSFFKNAISKQDWASKVHAVRDSLGKISSRKFKSAQVMTTLPGAPAGHYVVIQYDSSFENKPTAVETITPMLDKDGKWRISGYYIH